MVASVGSNDKAEMYNYLGGVKNDKRSDALDVAFKQENPIFILPSLWICGLLALMFRRLHICTTTNP